MPTPTCLGCAQVAAHCICAGIPSLQSRTRVLVLQHPQESQHPKNTLRLAALALPAIVTQVGETADDFADLARVVESGDFGKVALCYPPESDAPAAGCGRADTLIVIDATWRKAHKMLMSNPWLQALPRLALNQAGDYRLRKTSVTAGLSTLESVAWALNAIEGFDPQPLLDVQSRWIHARLAQMPPAVQARYER